MKQYVSAILTALGLLSCVGAPREQAPEGYQGALVIAPDPVAFGDTPVGCVSSVTLSIGNGNADSAVTITDVTSSDPDLTLSRTFPLTLGPGASTALDLHLTPLEQGDRTGLLVFATDEGNGAPYRLATTAKALAAPARPTDLASIPPLDLVFVLDVSTSMNEMANLRSAIAGLFDFIRANDLDVRFGLTTFVNDVIVHERGEFLDREAFFRELDGQLEEGTWAPSGGLPRQQANFDLAENVLDALHRSATDFAFRPGSRRYFVLMTDDTFQEPPAVFTDGTASMYSYEEVVQTLRENDVRLFSVHSRVKGRGLSSSYGDEPSLVSATRGTWFEIADLESGRVTLDGLLADLAMGRTCL